MVEGLGSETDWALNPGASISPYWGFYTPGIRCSWCLAPGATWCLKSHSNSKDEACVPHYHMGLVADCARCLTHELASSEAGLPDSARLSWRAGEESPGWSYPQPRFLPSPRAESPGPLADLAYLTGINRPVAQSREAPVRGTHTALVYGQGYPSIPFLPQDVREGAQMLRKSLKEPDRAVSCL